MKTANEGVNIPSNSTSYKKLQVSCSAQFLLSTDKRTGPFSKNVPQTVNALVDREMLNKSIQSIFDKQVCPGVKM
jgi:hypothetical protein